MRLRHLIPILLLFIFAPVLLKAQDNSIEIRLPASVLSPVQNLPEGMSYEEFLKLQRRITWGRWFMAMGIPGYIHFYAHHNRIAWSIVGVRTVSFAVMMYSMIDQINLTDSFSFNISEMTSDKERTRRNFYLFMGGLMVNALGFIVDWTHGDWIIEKEKNEVLYKYGKKKLHAFTLTPIPEKSGWGVHLSFRF